MKLTNNKRNAFTLMELILAVSIISLLTVVAFANVNEQTKIQKANRAVQQSAWAIKQARHYARMKGVKTELIFDTGSTVYTINADGQDITNNSRMDALSGVLPEGVKVLNNACGNIYFDVDGSPVDSVGDVILNDCTIALGYDSNSQKNLTLKAISGNIIYEK